MDDHVLPTYLRAEEVFVSGKGAMLRTADGREYLDFLGGIAVNALGHDHPKLIAALREQLGLLHVSNLYRHPLTELVASRLARLSGLESVFFTNSGAEANEAALKIARKYHRQNGDDHRTGFVALEGGFHGRTLGALSVTGTARFREPFAPLLQCTFVPRADTAALEQALASEPAALILEPIQGESGVLDLGDECLRAARAACTATGTLLIADEVQTGCGRTGTFLCCHQADVLPDLATLAKPLAAGLPMGACLVAPHLAQVLVPGDHGSTFAGGPLACRAALVLLDALQDGLQEQVQRRGARLCAGLGTLGPVRGRGLMLALHVPGRARALQQHLHQLGLLANATGPDTLRLLPPYVITDEQIDRGLALIGEALQELAKDPNP